MGYSILHESANLNVLKTVRYLNDKCHLLKRKPNDHLHVLANGSLKMHIIPREYLYCMVTG